MQHPVRQAQGCKLLVKALTMFFAGKLNVLSYALLLLMATSYVHAVPPGTIISNTAQANFDVSGAAQVRSSNQVDITTSVILSPATISFLQYSPTGSGATPTLASPSACSTSGSSGPFNNLPNPNYLGVGALDASLPLDLAPAASYHQGEPIFIRVEDANRNIDSAVRDTLVVTIRSTVVGDEEILQLTETDIDTGIFVGYIQSVTTPVIPNDCVLAVQTNELIQVSYTDIFDVTDVVSTTVLVDPFGIVFDSVTGEPINGITVTLIDTATNLPANVFGDDLVSAYPSTVITGSSVTDAGGTDYNFAAGEYRFPSVAPGTYRLEVIAPEYQVPSSVSIAQLQTLSGAPFALDANASFMQEFTLVVGPPLNVDIPIDPISDLLFVTKNVSKTEVAVGDFLQYEVIVNNNRPLDAAVDTLVIDQLPVGFRYQEDSLQINGSSSNAVNVSEDGSLLSIPLGDLPATSSVTIKYVVEVTAGAALGSAVNSAFARDNSGAQSNVAQATVRIIDDLLSTRSFLIGLVLQNACEKDDAVSYGQVNYRLTSELQDREVVHRLALEVSEDFDNRANIQVSLPKLLEYQSNSARLDGVTSSEPILNNGLLVFTLDLTTESRVFEFTSLLKQDLLGVYQAQAKIILTDSTQANISSNWLSNSIQVGEADTLTDRLVVNNAQGENGVLNVAFADNKKGVEGIKLYLEDGRYVVTDERGMYHFEGIEPGTHVVQIDPSSIPDNLEIQQCVENTRTAGAKYSQFVDIQPGLLWRANFYLAEKQQVKKEIIASLDSQLDDELINYRLKLDGDFSDLKNVRVSVILPPGVQYKTGTSALNDQSQADPADLYGTLTYKLGEQLSLQNNNYLEFVALGAPDSQGELSTQVLISYDTQETKNQRLNAVESVLFYQQEKSQITKQVLRSNFASLSAELNNQGQQDLGRLIASLDKESIKHVHIIGHTDNAAIRPASQALFKDNQALSVARAKSVAQYLSQNFAIDSSIIKIEGQGELAPVADNNSRAGRALNRRVEVIVETVQVVSPQQKEILKRHNQVVKTVLNDQKKIDKVKTNYKKPSSTISIETYDKTWLDSTDNQVEWLLPVEGANPEIASIDIAIKHTRAQKVKLLLNSEVVSPVNLDKRVISTDGSKVIARWRGVDVQEGDNQLQAIIYDKADNELIRLDKNVHVAGQPVEAILQPQYSRLIADGRSPIILAVKFIDQWGYPARPGVVGEYLLSPEYQDAVLKRELDKQPLNGLLKDKTRYKIEADGIAYIELEPSTRSGKATLDFAFIDEREQTLTAWISAQQKEWILVGLAEGTAGYNNISGNAEALDEHQHEDDLYEDGRLAFFGKGQIKGEWLMTLAYDSDRKERNSAERLFQTIDPDEYYTLYGDASEQQFDAASSRKLYVKLEKQQFYGLFGDFNTDLTITELSRYSRSMTGVKSEFEGKHVGFNAFAADTDQIFVRDEIQGNGTSGLYRLSNGNIVINSEKIRLETRDRFRPQVIIEQQQLSQFLDYSIDTVNGTLFFKQPIQSRDENLNPIFIVADYEVSGANDKQITAGGRAAIYSEDKKSELGFSAVSQGDTQTEGHLVGVDANYQLNKAIKLQLEAARSKTEFNDNSDTGTAYLAEIEHRSERVDANAYFRRQSSNFGLEQQSASNSGTKRYGLDSKYKLSETLNINTEAYRDEVLSTEDKRTVIGSELEKTDKQYQLAAGVRYAKDKLTDQDDNDSLQATGRASRYLFDGRVQLRANTEVELSNDNSVDYPTRILGGVDYKLNEVTELFAEHEYTQGEDQDTNTSRVGTRLSPWKEATINTSVEQQNSENGARTFSNLGLVQGWQFNDKLRLDFSLDRSDTLRDPGGDAFNNNVPLSSGTVSDDFTAGSFGANYTEEMWSAASRAEYRTSDSDIQRSLFLGYYREEYTGIGMSLDLQAFDTNSRSGRDQVQVDMNYSVAYRPDFSAWTVLNKFELNYDNTVSADSRIRSRKAVNNLNLNYTIDDQQQFATHWGFKYNLDNIDGEEYDGFTHLLGFQYIYDIHKRLDLSLHGDILYSSNADNYRYSLGPAIGFNLYKNLWLSVGYNIDGFEDEDFSQSEYTANGPYLKLRFKFDKNTLSGLLKK